MLTKPAPRAGGASPAWLVRCGVAILAAGAIAAALAGCSKKSTTAPVVSGCPDDPGIICTWAGTGAAGYGGAGMPLLESPMYWPIDLTITPSGDMYVLDWNNHRVRHVTAQGTFETIIGTDFIGDGPLDRSDLTAPGAPGTDCNLNHPTAIEPLQNGLLLLTAWHNHKLREWDPGSGRELVTCGSSAGYRGDGGPARDAKLNQPSHAIQASDGSIYVMDQRNQRIRRIDLAGVITTVVGATVPDSIGPSLGGFSGDGGPPLDAEINQPSGSNPQPGGTMAFDAQGRLYFADRENHRVRRVDFVGNIIETVAGNGIPAFGGDGGPATQASLHGPRDVEVGPDGRVYIADEFNHRIRAYDPLTGTITTVAGSDSGFAGDGGPATAARLARPQGIEFDALGRLYIVDTFNQRIRRMRLP